MRYTDEHFTNVVNEVTSLLDGGLVVEISGRIVKSNGSTIDEYNALFYTRAQFDLYYNNLQDTSDVGESKFTGPVKTVETNIRFKKRRSQAEMGTNYSYQIKEYYGVNWLHSFRWKMFYKVFQKIISLCDEC